mgnify:CR=1 FL=1
MDTICFTNAKKKLNNSILCAGNIATGKAAEKMVRTGGGVLSHPVGLAVHDDGPYRYGPLKVGHVFSVDPQMWVPEENLYLRYEDTIVVTKDGNENFTDFLPSELDDLESLVRQKGMLQSYPKDLMKWNY